MIKISLITSEKGFEELLVKGHANSAPYGEDLVCAAVSAIVLGGANALNEADYSFKVEEGYVDIKRVKEISKRDEIVIETMLTQLESLASSYPKNVGLERK